MKEKHAPKDVCFSFFVDKRSNNVTIYAYLSNRGNTMHYKQLIKIFLGAISTAMLLLAMSACGHDHKFCDWNTVKAVTCTESGTKERICECGEKETKEIAALGHDYIFESEAPATLYESGEIKETCSRCDDQKSTVVEIDPSVLNIPIVNISDCTEGAIPLTELQKANGEITVKYSYLSCDDSIDSFECFCEIKVQGASSAVHPKKNFTVKFFEDQDLNSKFKVDLGWGKEHKYCMKANYIDASQARNIIGAKLFAQLVSTRDHIPLGLMAAPNYGLIDGYPVLVYINDAFHGIYTMNIPKDDWMFAMEGDEEAREALLMADAWTESVMLNEEIGDSYTDSGWEIEHCSTDDDAWVCDSFNKLIALLNCGDNTRIRNELANHLDIEASIDNMLYTYFISAADNVGKNVLWATYDGEIWIPSMYDMDGTFGIYWNGVPVGTTEPQHAAPLFPSIDDSGARTIPGMKLYSVLITCFPEEVEARWTELRQDILTAENTARLFDAFFAKIPPIAYTSDAQKWTDVPYFDVNLTNMYTFTAQHLERLDAFFYHFNK